MSAAPTTSRKRMGRKKGEPKVPLYVKIPESLRDLFVRIAEAHGRKLNAEMVRALEAYCEQHRGDLAEEPEEQP